MRLGSNERARSLYVHGIRVRNLHIPIKTADIAHKPTHNGLQALKLELAILGEIHYVRVRSHHLYLTQGRVYKLFKRLRGHPAACLLKLQILGKHVVFDEQVAVENQPCEHHGKDNQDRKQNPRPQTVLP